MKRTRKHPIAMPRSQEAYQEELMALKIKMALEKEQQDEIARMQAACEKDLELQQFFLKTQPQTVVFWNSPKWIRTGSETSILKTPL